MGNGGQVSKPTRHEHGLHFKVGLRAYKCSGCKGRGGNTGYTCRSCPEFVLHRTCADLPDEYVHPFLAEQNPFEFRRNTLMRHNCDACGLLIRGFVFQSSKGCRLHPLCLMLPLQFRHSGHLHDNLQLFNQEGGKYGCMQCGKENINWKYRCRTLTCRVRLDMNCAIIDIHRLSRHGITQVYKPSQTQHALRMVARVGTVVCTSLLGVAATALINREVDHGEGNNEEEAVGN